MEQNMKKNYPVEFTSVVDLLIREYKKKAEDENNIMREDIKDLVDGSAEAVKILTVDEDSLTID